MRLEYLLFRAYLFVSAQTIDLPAVVSKYFQIYLVLYSLDFAMDYMSNGKDGLCEYSVAQ